MDYSVIVMKVHFGLTIQRKGRLNVRYCGIKMCKSAVLADIRVAESAVFQLMNALSCIIRKLAIIDGTANGLLSKMVEP